MSWIDDAEYNRDGNGPDDATLDKLIAAARWAEAQVVIMNLENVPVDDWLAACVARDAAESAYRAVRDK